MAILYEAKREYRPIQSTDVKVNSCRCPKAQAAKVPLYSLAQNLSRVPVQTTTLEAKQDTKRRDREEERRRGKGRGEKQQVAEEASTSRSSGNEVVGPVIEERPTQWGDDRRRGEGAKQTQSNATNSHQQTRTTKRATEGDKRQTTQAGADPPDRKENQQKPQNTKGKRKSTQGHRGAAEEHKAQECRRCNN